MIVLVKGGPALARYNSLCFFVSDRHGRRDRYEALFEAISDEEPGAVFLGGDLLPPMGGIDGSEAFVEDFLRARFLDLWQEIKGRGGARPQCMLILGNDDPRSSEAAFMAGEEAGAWLYLHKKIGRVGDHPVHGYPFVPPTPFGLKDWERYDVSRFVDPGCVSPEEGYRSVATDVESMRYRTILRDLNAIEGDLHSAIMLFHSPPYKSLLDRAGLDGVMVEHVPVDVHVGSIAIQRFIEERQPLLTLHGHIHESARLKGAWRDKIGETHCFSAAHDGPELALVRFDPDDLDSATRKLI